MKTKWTDPAVSNLFDAYDDHVEAALGYRPLIAELRQAHGDDVAVLDYGCGGGKVSRRLVDAGISRVTGVDVSPTMIAKARAHPLQKGLDYHAIDSGRLPFPDACFDAAVCCFVFINIHARDELGRVAAEIFRTLKPGGTLYLLDSHPGSTGVRFTAFQNGDPGIHYEDGAARPVYLDIPGQSVFNIVDNHWALSTYQAVFRDAGFADVRMIERRSGDLPAQETTRLGDNEAARPPFILFKAGKGSAPA